LWPQSSKNECGKHIVPNYADEVGYLFGRLCCRSARALIRMGALS
jgi:hypothetical protein